MTASGEAPAPRVRRRRADAERSRAAILDAAVRLLRDRPEAGLETIARTAGVTRQTVYAHFSSRDELLAAAVDRVTADAVAAMDAAALDEGPAVAALLRFLDASWRAHEANAFLLRAASARTSGSESDRERHEPVTSRLARLFERGITSGEFVTPQDPRWLVAAVVALGHAAGDEITAGRLTAPESEAALRVSVLRLLGVEDTWSVE
ncbi:TetR/AcrR family transcriptional regulator [Streptomyces sp. YH02]|uniref:TetR/AcrR family transcriptional regulator n=1 Tax=Streptomyces sp. YH02 TaxID=3256999 RepID=UPI00375791F4